MASFGFSPRSSLLRDQDSHVISVLKGFVAAVDGDQLTLSLTGNRGLVYRLISPDELAVIPEVPVGNDARLLGGTSWVLIHSESENGPVVVVSGFEPGMTFSSDGGLSGNLSCNDFTSDVNFEGIHLNVGLVTQTKSACSESGVMDAEAAFVAALGAVADFSVERDGDILVLVGDVVLAELAFERVDPTSAAAD